MILFGFFVDNPKTIINGMYRIILEPGTLITDYIGIGGIGAAFVNSGLLTLIFVMLLCRLRINFNGATFAALFLISGFSLFGKNLFNVWFVVFGVFLFAKVQREKFSKYIYVALFGTAMAPLVTEIIFTAQMSFNMRLIIGIFSGISIGFILPPLAAFLIRVHQGFNLYNIGFTAGMVGTIYVSLFKSFGFTPSPKMIWTTGNNLLLGSFFYLVFLTFIVTGFIMNHRSLDGIKGIIGYPGRLVTDFIILEGFPPTLINMGINGLISLSYVILIGGDLNGPTISGILTVVGFGAFGKHFRNITPILMGVFIGSLIKVFQINDPHIQLAALFGTALAPIAGEFGWGFGILAGLVHSSVVLNVGALHGGLNLYNNGFAAGIVASVLVPVIEAFRRDDD
ncbi:DUF1576 domain-containing protein [Clostridiaceae bacterium M8S5]|nr:DUF1576 domain-containing protein [Clostridiaceae bacterium M8S5]